MKTIAALFALILTVLFAPLPARADDIFPSQRVYLPSISSVPASGEEDVYFKVARVIRCDPNAGLTYVNGTVKADRQPANGYVVAFSYAADGPVVATTISGPHAGYPGWPDGFFSHILSASGPRAGDWYFWIVDESDVRISEIAYLHTDGEANENSCQQAVLEFDTRYPGGTGVLPPH